VNETVAYDVQPDFSTEKRGEAESSWAARPPI
jgi:hypothetical protein